MTEHMRKLLKAANRELEKAREFSEAGDVAQANERMDKHEELMTQYRQQEELAEKAAKNQRLIDQSRERNEIRGGTDLIITPEDFRSRGRVIARFRRHGREALNDAEWALFNRLTEREQAWWDYMGADPTDELGVQEARRKLMKAAAAEVRALSTTAGVGGETIPTGFYAMITAEMEAYGPMAEADMSLRIVTDGGEDLPMPTVTNVGKFRATGEGAVFTEVEPDTDDVTLGAHKYTGQQILSFELLQDTGVDLEGFIMMFAAEGLGRGLNEDFTIGDGAGKATGLLSVPAARQQNLAAPDSLTAEDITALIHKLDPAYRAMAVLQTNDATIRLMKLLKSGDDYLWRQWGGGVATFAERPPDTWDGYPLRTNQAVPQLSAAASSNIMTFHHRRCYTTRLAGSYRIRRSDERYAEKDQILFTHAQRADGKVLRASGIAVLRNET